MLGSTTSRDVSRDLLRTLHFIILIYHAIILSIHVQVLQLWYIHSTKKSWLFQVTQACYSLVGAWRKKSLHSAMSNIWQVKMSSRFKDLQMKSGDESTLLPSSVKSSWRRPTCSQNLLMRSAAEMLFSVSQVDSESSNWNHFKWHFVSVRHTSWWRFAYPHQVLAVEGTLSVRSDISNRVYIHSPLIHHSRLWQPWCKLWTFHFIHHESASTRLTDEPFHAVRRTSIIVIHGVNLTGFDHLYREKFFTSLDWTTNIQ